MADAVSIPSPEVVARRLDHARQLKGWTWTDLAVRAAVSRTTLSNLHRGRRPWEALNLGAAVRLCRALDISLDWLIGPSSLAPSGEEVWSLSQPERETYLMQRVAEALQRSQHSRLLNDEG